MKYSLKVQFGFKGLAFALALFQFSDLYALNCEGWGVFGSYLTSCNACIYRSTDDDCVLTCGCKDPGGTSQVAQLRRSQCPNAEEVDNQKGRLVCH